MSKIKELELKKLILELELIEIDESYAKEFVSNYRGKFNEHLKKISPEFYNKSNSENADSNSVIEREAEKVIDADEEELKKIKKIYKEISKICHPDKTKDDNLNNLYVEAKLLYEKNDLLGLIKISNKISLDFEIDSNDVSILKRTLQDKKAKLMKIEGTFLWLWVNAETEEQKESIIKMYVQQHS